MLFTYSGPCILVNRAYSMKYSAQALFCAVFILLRQKTRAIPASILSEPCLLLFAATTVNTRSPPPLFFNSPQYTLQDEIRNVYSNCVFRVITMRAQWREQYNDSLLKKKIIKISTEMILGLRKKKKKKEFALIFISQLAFCSSFS